MYRHIRKSESEQKKGTMSLPDGTTYCFFQSESPWEAVKEMERLMKIHDDVLRVLTIKVDKHKKGPSIMLQSKAKNDEKMARKGFEH